jgi:hypothetical protein
MQEGYRIHWFPLAGLALLLTAGTDLRAQVSTFNVFKITVYQQTSPAPPVAPDAPNAYFFGAQLNTTNSFGYVDVYFDGPNQSAYLNELTPFYFDFGSPYYADKPDFDADYPGGEYDFYVDHANFSEFGSVTIPGQEFYAANSAAFTTNCWNALQQVDPAMVFTLNWNSFAASPGTTSAYSFIDIYDENAGTEPFAADFLTPDTVTTNIPANTLRYGKTYRINAIFSNRQDTSNAGFGSALGTVGFDKLTYAQLVTIPPWLHIALANTNVLLTWPALATNFELQAVNQLPGPGVWPAVTNQPAIVGSTNVLLLPAAAASEFFRLAAVNSL